MADLSNVVRMLIHQLDATRSYLLPSYCDEDEKARAVIAFAESALAAEPPAPAEPSDFQTLQGIALDMVESLRPIVIPEILGVLRRAIKQPPAPAPSADGEREELANRLGWIAAQLSDIGWGDDSASVARAAALLRQPAPAPVPVPVAERPWERPGWCDAEGRCWIGTPETEYPLGDTGDYDLIDASWSLELPPSDPALQRMQRVVSHPHWAIPQPPQGGEVKA